VKTFLSLVTLVLSISATSLSAQAFCGQVGIYFVCRRLVPVLVGGVEPPKQRHEKAYRTAPPQHVAKRPKSQLQEEKAPPAGAPPPLPPNPPARDRGSADAG
jgi:hypothetical protein